MTRVVDANQACLATSSSVNIRGITRPLGLPDAQSKWKVFICRYKHQPDIRIS
jgi:hypothetical protein